MQPEDLLFLLPRRRSLTDLLRDRPHIPCSSQWLEAISLSWLKMTCFEEFFQNEIPSRRLGIPCFRHGSTTRRVMPGGKGRSHLVPKDSCTCPYRTRPLRSSPLGCAVLDIGDVNWKLSSQNFRSRTMIMGNDSKLFALVFTLGSLSRQIQSETFGPWIVWPPSLFL